MGHQLFRSAGEVPVASIIQRGSESVTLHPRWAEYQNKMDAEGLQYQRARQQRMADPYGDDAWASKPR
jgi:hypothetical protein